MTKNWSKIDHKLVIKNRSQFDYQKGDSGSAGFLERKCVMIEAPNLVTKSDTNRCQQQKSLKNHQNQKIIKIEKMQKVTKSSKLKKWKSDKIIKVRKWKSEKVCQNSPSDPPHVDFGLRIGSRGTPRDWKSAGPGGSDFAKCRFWPFIWHFGLFEGGSIFDTFFVIFWFFTFITFSLFVFCAFSRFCDFSDFDVFHFFAHYCN